MTRIEQYDAIATEARELFMKKNTDYGDSFAEDGPIGVLVRMKDKLSRAVNVSKSGITLVSSESLRETSIDLKNYATMIVMLLDQIKEYERNVE